MLDAVRVRLQCVQRDDHRLNGFEELECRFLLSSTSVYWNVIDSIPYARGAETYLRTSTYEQYALNIAQLRSSLNSAPLENSEGAPVVVSLPNPNGTFEEFNVVESPIMAPGLAAKFPEIRTYRGQGITDKAATVRFDMTPAGFHGQVLSPSGAYYIDPYFHLRDDIYASYFAGDATEPPEFQELTSHNVETPTITADEPAVPVAMQSRSGAQLRTYRIAVAATGEYTTFHGGTVAMGQAAIATAINRVSGIYENELSIRLELVTNNSSLVYTNAGTDPYTNNDADLMLDQNQANIDSVIGNANYDIGHVFATDGAGLAGFGVVGQTGSKAMGTTGIGNPVGDPFYVDYVAHEIGHQFRGSHTFNGDSSSCAGANRDANAAYEPGSGSTIQAYAGICADDNLQNNSDPYFHSVSFDEIINFVDNVIPAVGIRTATGNTIPTVDAGADYTIPANTPFTITATGSDGNGDTLTYNWEQRDLGPQQDVNAGDNGSSPLFRSFLPTTDPTRTFPRMSELLNNTTVIGETLPTTNRALNFRATVRDNRSGGGGVNSDDMVISVVEGSPFQVTSPNTELTWTAGGQETVMWDVASTNSGAINATNVNILLSTDGGLTFDTTLASNVSNNGSQTVNVPITTTSQARVKVEAVGNIFFDVSNTDFMIGSSTETCTATDGFGYQACTTAFIFEDISTTGTVFTGFAIDADDESAELNDAALGDFEFEFYGVNYNSLFVSTNGLFSFNTRLNEYDNTDLTTETQPVIAAFWDDLKRVTGNVYWEVKGSGDRERLIVQWDQWDYFDGGSDEITFQAILDEYDNSIRLNYQDVTSNGSTQTDGASATVGIKDAGAQGAKRLLISQNSGPDDFVASGKSIIIHDTSVAVFDGSASVDTFSLDTSGANYVAILNGHQTFLNPVLVRQVKFDGRGNNDSMTVTGGASNETAILNIGSLRFTKNGFEALGDRVEMIVVNAGTGNDQADLFDSVGNDSYFGRPTYSYVTGNGFFNRVNNFDTVRSYATTGNIGGVGDRAYLYDSKGNDSFYGRPNYSRLFGNGFNNFAVGFDTVRGYGTAGNAGGVGDQAYLYDSQDDDRFFGRHNYSRMFGAGFDNFAAGFDTVRGYATAGSAGGGGDQAFLYDSAGNDSFFGRPTHSRLFGAGFNNFAAGFDSVNGYATAGGGTDRAYLYDSSGNDSFYAYPTFSYLTGSGFLNRANGFDRVNGYATGDAGGNGDEAFLYDSAGNDSFYGRPADSRLLGSGFFNFAVGFDSVSAFAIAGDMGNTGDRAFLFDSDGDDTFFGRNDFGRLFGSGFLNFAQGFDSINANGNAGGVDTLDVDEGIVYGLTESGWENVL